MRLLKKKRLWIAAALILWVLWANRALEVNEYTIRSSRIPDSFSGFRIVQISDLHNTQFGADNSKLLTMIRDAKPDIIVITGDLIDSRSTDIGVALDFLRNAVEIAPVYYVTGNHESRIAEFSLTDLESAGAAVLENEKVQLERAGECITLMGLHDPTFSSLTAHALDVLTEGEEDYTILLSHRPELFEMYTQCSVDLVFTGHAHGGQFRIPFVGGLVAPHQGFFPEYDAGLYTRENTNMLVSRGIGNSVCPIRINNRPEIIVVQLEFAQ